MRRQETAPFGLQARIAVELRCPPAMEGHLAHVLEAGYASVRGASDEKRAASEYKAEGGGLRRLRPTAHWCVRARLEAWSMGCSDSVIGDIPGGDPV
jgi:hypothetical protein